MRTSFNFLLFAFWIVVFTATFFSSFFAPHLKTTQRGGAGCNFGRQNLPDLKWTQIVLHRAFWLVHFPPSCSGIWIARASLSLLSFFSSRERTCALMRDPSAARTIAAAADLGHSIITFFASHRHCCRAAYKRSPATFTSLWRHYIILCICIATPCVLLQFFFISNIYFKKHN